MKRKRFIPIAAGVLLILCGCGDTLTRQQPQDVAKDWCMTIRASQIIPVYPLHEDLQPGDVFLVTTPIRREAERYSQKKFLPLDFLQTRLQTSDEYEAFYKDAYLEGFGREVPHGRPSPTALTESNDNPITSGTSNPDTSAASASVNTGRYSLTEMPAAQFPTYTFDVRAGQGLRLAIPVQGIPVGLGILNSQAATGSIIIRDAFTYALPADVLLPRLQNWANELVVRRELARLKHSVGSSHIYLRVVNRVYLVGGVDVLLTAVRSGLFGVDAGAPQNVNLIKMNTEDLRRFKDNAELYRDAVEGINGSLQDVKLDPAGNLLPGGSARAVMATSRTVTMEENFNCLLALGYLGFDVEILRNGELGPAVSTFYSVGEQEPYSAVGRRHASGRHDVVASGVQGHIPFDHRVTQ